KGRRRKASLAMPDGAFARQQALAEDRADVAKEKRKLDEIAMVPDQHILGMIGVVEEYSRPGAEAQRYNLSVLSRPFLVVTKHVATELGQVAEERKPFRPGRSHAGSTMPLRFGRGRRHRLS